MLSNRADSLPSLIEVFDEHNSWWAEQLRGIQQRVGASGLRLLGYDEAERLLFGWSLGFSASANSDFELAHGEDLRSYDPLRAIIADNERRTWSPGAAPAANGTFGCRITAASTCTTVLLCHGKTAQSPSGKHNAALQNYAEALRPHLQLLIDHVHQANALALNVMNSTALCGILLDGYGRVVAVSTRASRIVEEGGLLGIFRGRLTCADPKRSHDLANVMDAMAAASRAGREATATLAIDWNGQTVPLDFSALPRLKGSIGLESAIAIVVRTPPLRDTPRQLDLLRNIFRLTTAEAEVALELARGTRLTVLAGQRGVSYQTLKSQLRQIFDKTGTARQSELVVELHRRLGSLTSAI